MKEIITKVYRSEIEALNSHLDQVAESVFTTLLAECEYLSELEDRVFVFDNYSDFPADIGRLNELIASRVRKKAKAYINNIKSQYKIVSGE